MRIIVRRESCEKDGLADRLYIEIIDTGMGMSALLVSRLFLPFVQADSSTTREFGGTGSGVYAISRRLARSLGGDIVVESQPGIGSRFTFSLPIVPATGVQAPPEKMAECCARLAARVLVVEDGEDNQLLLSHVLQRAGATVSLARDGTACLEQVARSLETKEPYDLILMDIQMPGIDGNEATRRLRALGIRTPIIALSAAAMPENRVRSLAAGCDDFLLKPIDTDELVKTLQRWAKKQGVTEKG